MRVVLDTNVLVSGVFFGGVPGRLLSAWATDKVFLVLSPAILSEYRHVGYELGIGYPERSASFDAIVALIVANAVIVDPLPLLERVSDDANDDMFLAAAVASKTQVVVSGDKHLLRVSGWRGIEVLTPRQFDDRLRSAP